MLSYVPFTAVDKAIYQQSTACLSHWPGLVYALSVLPAMPPLSCILNTQMSTLSCLTSIPT